MNIQRTDIRKWAILPISSDVRWAVWNGTGRTRTLAVYAPGVTVNNGRHYNRLGTGDSLILDAKDEDISRWGLTS